MRPGEKLHEELISNIDAQHTIDSKIFCNKSSSKHDKMERKIHEA